MNCLIFLWKCAVFLYSAHFTVKSASLPSYYKWCHFHWDVWQVMQFLWQVIPILRQINDQIHFFLKHILKTQFTADLKQIFILVRKIVKEFIKWHTNVNSENWFKAGVKLEYIWQFAIFHVLLHKLTIHGQWQICLDLFPQKMPNLFIYSYLFYIISFVYLMYTSL